MLLRCPWFVLIVNISSRVISVPCCFLHSFKHDLPSDCHGGNSVPYLFYFCSSSRNQAFLLFYLSFLHLYKIMLQIEFDRSQWLAGSAVSALDEECVITCLLGYVYAHSEATIFSMLWLCSRRLCGSSICRVTGELMNSQKLKKCLNS